MKSKKDLHDLERIADEELVNGPEVGEILSISGMTVANSESVRMSMKFYSRCRSKSPIIVAAENLD